MVKTNESFYETSVHTLETMLVYGRVWLANIFYINWIAARSIIARNDGPYNQCRISSTLVPPKMLTGAPNGDL